MTFYDNINEFFTKNGYIKNIIDEPTINIFQSKIIKEYKNILKGSDDYFEDNVMDIFNEYFDRCDDADAYDNICNNIIFIYYKSTMRLNRYYCDIFKKKKIYL
jgi:hypothetical protein